MISGFRLKGMLVSYISSLGKSGKRQPGTVLVLRLERDVR